jgi:hypothetical protein
MFSMGLVVVRFASYFFLAFIDKLLQKLCRDCRLCLEINMMDPRMNIFKKKTPRINA